MKREDETAGEEEGDGDAASSPSPTASRFSGMLRVGACGLSGVGMALLFPPFDLGGLVWVVFMPLLAVLWSVDGPRAGRKGFGFGMLAGSNFFLINLHWLTTVSWLGWLLLSSYLALFFGIWGFFVSKFANPWRTPERTGSAIECKIRARQGEASHWVMSTRSLMVAFSVASLWCGLEWLRGWLFTGFGWNPIGVAFHQTPVMAQAADLLGVVGLSFVPIFLQAVMLQTGRRLIAEAKAGRMRAHIDFGVAAVLVALCFCYGVWRIHTENGRETVRLKALLVQLNIPQLASRRLWTPEEIHFAYEEETLGALAAIEEENERRLEKAIETGEEVSIDDPEWIVWPESALVGRLLRLDNGDWATWMENQQTIERVQGGRTLVMGMNEIEGEVLGEHYVEKENARHWNSLVVFSPEDESVASFRKHHLVIFGEYIPLVDTLPFLKAIYEQQAGATYGGAFARGESLDPLPMTVSGEEVGMIPSVCFEDTVPRLMRKFVRGGPQLIMNVTNDGWFKQSPAAAQHFANAKFRAIELRRPMLRCANTGVSAAVTTIGTTAHSDTGEKQELRDEQGSHLTRGWLLAELPIPKKPSLTLYAVIGDWGVIGLGLVGLLPAIVRRK